MPREIQEVIRPTAEAQEVVLRRVHQKTQHSSSGGLGTPLLSLHDQEWEWSPRLKTEQQEDDDEPPIVLGLVVDELPKLLERSAGHRRGKGPSSSGATKAHRNRACIPDGPTVRFD